MEGGEVPFSFGDGSGGARRSLREELSRESRFGSFSRGGDRNSWGRFRSTAPAPPPAKRRASKASGKFQEAAEGSLRRAHHYQGSSA